MSEIVFHPKCSNGPDRMGTSLEILTSKILSRPKPYVLEPKF